VKILAIDPGSSTGWAMVDVVDDLQTGEASVELVRSGRMAAPLFTVAAGFLRQDRPDLLIVEGQWYGGGNFTSVSYLIERRMAWVHAAELEGISCEVVNARAWISAATKGVDGASSKDRIRNALDQIYPGRKFKRDEEDAVLMAIWRAKKL